MEMPSPSSLADRSDKVQDPAVPKRNGLRGDGGTELGRAGRTPAADLGWASGGGPAVEKAGGAVVPVTAVPEVFAVGAVEGALASATAKAKAPGEASRDEPPTCAASTGGVWGPVGSSRA
eukprot:scaffold10615_cov106-Isochrysis_galbana.AAC.5